MGTKSGQQQQETAAQRALADHAVNLLQDYRQRWLPVQQRLAQQIEQAGEPDSAARRLATGKASTDTAIAFDKAGKGLESSLSNSGVSPGSSRGKLALTGMGGDAATSTGAGALMSDQMIDDAYTQGLGALTAIGRGERGLVGQGLTAQAQQSSAQAAADASASLMEHQGNAALGGQVVGFGLQQGLKGLPSMRPSGVSGTNDLPGVTGANAMAKWNQYGMGGD